MHIRLMTLLAGFLVPVTIHAQDATGSGSDVTKTEPDGAQMLSEMLTANADRPVKAYLLKPSDKVRKAWESDSKLLRQRIADQRSECREAVRKANRDQRLGKILQCERAILTLESSLIKKEVPFMLSIWVEPDTSAELTSAGAELTEAMESVIDGVDTGLFTNEDQLLTARKNLRDSYRLPYRLAKAAARADRELTYINYIAKRIYERTDNTSPLMEDIAVCLTDSYALFEGAKSASTSQEQASAIAAGRLRTRECTDHIKTLIKADRQAASSDEIGEASGNETE